MITNATVEAKWTNPRMVQGKFQVDAEFKCLNDVDRKLAAMNMRAWFDSNQFESSEASMRFLNFFPDWRIGPYQILKGNVGNAASKVLFNTSGPASYINCAIEGPYFTEFAQNIPVLNNWVRYFTLELTPKNYIPGQFAPMLLWDKEQDESRGGFLFNDGLTISLCVSNSNTKENTKYAYCNEDVKEQLNWTYNGSLTYPFGNPTNQVIL